MRSATNETCRHDAPRERRRANLSLARERVSFVTRKESSDKATCAMQYSSSWIDRSTVPQSRTRSSISAQRLEIREGLGLAMLKASVWIAQANGQGFKGVSASKGLRDPLPDRFESTSNRFDVPEKPRESNASSLLPSRDITSFLRPAIHNEIKFYRGTSLASDSARREKRIRATRRVGLS
ncbi:hypothetical protein ACS0PU_002463 [Formica fusca]